jgi:tetratricopeptide (TPR) repeat protein
LCRAELALEENKTIEAIKLFFKHKLYNKIIKIGRNYTDMDIVYYVAFSLAELEDYEEAIKKVELLIINARTLKDTESLNKYLEISGDWHYKIGETERAYDIYKEARAYEKAVDVATQLNKSSEEIKKLRALLARNKANFDSAIEIYRELDDIQMVNLMKGHQFKYHEDYSEAVNYFILSKEWKEVFDCIDKIFSLTSTGELPDEVIKLLKAARDISEENLSVYEKEKAVEWIAQVLENEDWEDNISAEEMGVAYEKFDSYVNAGNYYRIYWRDHEWAQEGWLRVKIAQCRYHEKRGESEKVNRIQINIEKKKHEWRV